MRQSHRVPRINPKEMFKNFIAKTRRTQTISVLIFNEDISSPSVKLSMQLSPNWNPKKIFYVTSSTRFVNSCRIKKSKDTFRKEQKGKMRPHQRSDFGCSGWSIWQKEEAAGVTPEEPLTNRSKRGAPLPSGIFSSLLGGALCGMERGFLEHSHHLFEGTRSSALKRWKYTFMEAASHCDKCRWINQTGQPCRGT